MRVSLTKLNILKVLMTQYFAYKFTRNIRTELKQNSHDSNNSLKYKSIAFF